MWCMCIYVGKIHTHKIKQIYPEPGIVQEGVHLWEDMFVETDSEGLGDSPMRELVTLSCSD